MRIPYLCSNIPYKTFYASLAAGNLEIIRITTELVNYKSSCA